MSHPLLNQNEPVGVRYAALILRVSLGAMYIAFLITASLAQALLGNGAFALQFNRPDQVTAAATH